MKFKKRVFLTCLVVFSMCGMEKQPVINHYDKLVMKLWGPLAHIAKQYIAEAKQTQNVIVYSKNSGNDTMIPLASFNGAMGLDEVTVFLHRKKEFLTVKKYDHIPRTYTFEEFQELLNFYHDKDFRDTKKDKQLEKEFFVGKQAKKSRSNKESRCQLQ